MIVTGLALLLTVALLAGGLQLRRGACRQRLERRRVRVLLEEQLTRHRIDALTRATLRAMGRVADDSRRPGAAV